MASDAQVLIELKLLTKKAEQQVKEFAAYMGSAFGGTGGGAGGGGKGASGGIKDANAGVDAYTTKIVKLTNALNTQKAAALAAWRAANPGGVIPGQKVNMGDGGGGGGGGYGGPVSMGPITGGGLATPPPVLSSSATNATVTPQTSSATNATVTPQTMLTSLFTEALTNLQQRFAKVTAGLADMRVMLGLVTFGLLTLLFPVKLLSKMFTEAAENARRLYAKSLTSGGLPLGFTAKRGMLADVLGVGEHEVMQYGKAIQHLNGRLSWAAKEQAKAAPELAAAAWEWRILRHDLAAVTTIAMSGLAPAMRGLAVTLQMLTRVMAAHDKVVWGTIGFMTKWSLMGMVGQLTGKAPAPEASARRYQTSPWERMGLVLGVGGMDNPAKETARNTSRMVSWLERIAQQLGNASVPGGSALNQINSP